MNQPLRKSRHALAKEIGVTHQAVYHWFSGKSRPSLVNAMRLAHALDMTLNQTVEYLRQSVIGRTR